MAYLTRSDLPARPDDRYGTFLLTEPRPHSEARTTRGVRRHPGPHDPDPCAIGSGVSRVGFLRTMRRCPIDNQRKMQVSLSGDGHRTTIRRLRKPHRHLTGHGHRTGGRRHNRATAHVAPARPARQRLTSGCPRDRRRHRRGNGRNAQVNLPLVALTSPREHRVLGGAGRPTVAAMEWGAPRYVSET